MAVADGRRLIRNAPYRWTFVVLNSGHDFVTSLSGTLSAQISIDSGSVSATTNTPVEIGSTGICYVDLTAAEMTGTIVCLKGISSKNNTGDALLVAEFEPGLDSGVAQAGSTSTSIKIRASASSQDDIYNGAVIEIVRGLGAGQVRTVADYVGSSTTVTVDRAWVITPDTTSVYLIHPRIASNHPTVGVPNVNVTQLSGETAALNVIVDLYKAGIESTVNDLSPSTTDFDGNTELTATNDFYNKSFLVFTSGNLKGLMRPIDDYTSGRNISFATTDAWPAAPANGDAFTILSYKP